MMTKLLSLNRLVESSDGGPAIYHKNKGDDVILALIKQLKNRKVFILTLIIVVLVSAWYYFN